MKNLYFDNLPASNTRMLSFVCSLIGLMSMLGVQAALPLLDENLNGARALTKGDQLSVSSGVVTREWTWTGKGFVTSGLLDSRSKQEWISKSSDEVADWKFPDLTEGDAKLISLSAKSSDDEGFTSQHLEVIAEIEYCYFEIYDLGLPEHSWFTNSSVAQANCRSGRGGWSATECAGCDG